ncbi:MAG: hypothetical protein RLZZ450_7569, partial [Pseudomonadota bacterium]
ERNVGTEATRPDMVKSKTKKHVHQTKVAA